MAKFTHIILWGVVLAAVLTFSHTGTAQQKSTKGPILKLAQELFSITRLDNADKRQSSPLRVAIWPFQKDKIPIAKQIADSYNDHLLAKLVKLNKGQLEFVARDALKTIIEDRFQTGALENGDQPIAALMKKASNVDVLIRGRLRVIRKGVSLSYKAIGMDGKILAQTVPVYLQLKEKEQNMVDDLLTVDRAVSEASRYFIENVSDIMELRLGGLYYENTGIQTPFALFLKEKIASSIQKEAANVLTDRRIRIISGSRRGGLGKKDRRSYILKGRYWILGQNLEIQLAIENRKSIASSWSGRIPTSYIKRLKFRPSRDFEHLRTNDGLGPFEFQLKCGKGNNPVYRIGEKLKLKMRVSENIWMYCFYVQANGQIIQIFPNPPFWRLQKSPMLKRNKWHQMPDPKLFPFVLTATKPIGIELIKCFATSRDVTGELPKTFRGNSLAPMSKNVLNKASTLFGSLEDVSVAEASLVINVTE